MSKITLHALILGFTCALLLAASPQTVAAEQGTAVVRVVTVPQASSGAVRFNGTPAGQQQLGPGGTASLSAELAVGSHASTLTLISPDLLSQGYSLTAITCNDRNSQGDVSTRTATFKLEKGETVSCIFKLVSGQDDDDSGRDPGDTGSPGDAGDEDGDTAGETSTGNPCACPREGRWVVVNHTGSMTCTGAMSMTMPLKASRGSGTLETREGCAVVHASGMSDDEADIDMHRQADCSYVGTVGGAHDGIPMQIKFHWNVKNAKRITGDLKSTVSQSGMTCRMSRTYELDFKGPGA